MEAVIFIGVQAVGKSSFYKERFFRTHIRISLDMLRTRHREDILLQACIDAEQSFVVDNTNPSVENRAKYIKIAKQSGFRVIGYYFQSRIEDAIHRNQNRPAPERIPQKGIRGTFGKLKLPSREEGFDELFYVSLNESNGFLVEEWSDEV